MDRAPPSPRAAIELALVIAAAWALGFCVQIVVILAFRGRDLFVPASYLWGAREGLLVGMAAVVAVVRRPRIGAPRALIEGLLLGVAVQYASLALETGHEVLTQELMGGVAPGRLESRLQDAVELPFHAGVFSWLFWTKTAALALSLLAFAGRPEGRLAGLRLAAPFAACNLFGPIGLFWCDALIGYARMRYDHPWYTEGRLSYRWEHVVADVAADLPCLVHVVVVTAALPLVARGAARLRNAWAPRLEATAA
jgi:hypothetical protein